MFHEGFSAASGAEAVRDPAKAFAHRALFVLVRPTRKAPKGPWATWIIARGAYFAVADETPLSPARTVTVVSPPFRHHVHVCIGKAVASYVLGVKPEDKEDGPWKPRGIAWRVEGCPRSGLEANVLEGAHPSVRDLDLARVPEKVRAHARALAGLQNEGADEEMKPLALSVDGWKLFVFSPRDRVKEIVVGIGHGKESVVEIPAL